MAWMARFDRPVIWLRLLVLVSFLFSGCSSQGPSGGRAATAKPTAAVIFIPGFYGTALARVDTGQRLFLTFGQSLWGETPLALNDPDLGVPGALPIRTDGLLDHVSIIPGIYSLDVYGDALEYLEREFGSRTQVVALTYDWRQSTFSAVLALHALIQKLQAEGVTRVALVAHSMGGLVASYYLRYGAHDFQTIPAEREEPSPVRAVVLAGVPWGGSLLAFRNLQIGTTLVLADKPLAALSLSTFPAMYELMPASQAADAFVGPDGRPLKDSLYDYAFWRKWGWGLLRYSAEAAITRKRETYTRLYLERAALLHRLMWQSRAKVSPNRLPALIIHGTGTPTPARAVWSASTLSERGKWTFGGDELQAEGDGSVTLAASEAPPALDAELLPERFQMEVKHEEMLRTEKIQEAVSHFLHVQGF